MKENAFWGRHLASAVVLVGASLTTLLSQAQDRTATALATASEVANVATERWAQRRGVYIDASAIADVAATTSAAVTAACWGHPTQCEQAADRQGVAADITAYLDSLVGNPVAVTLAGDHIFRRIGFDKSRMGWPSGPAANRYLAVRPPAGYATLSHVLWNGHAVVPRTASLLLLPMGVHGFAATAHDGRATRLRLSATRTADGKAIAKWTTEQDIDAVHVPWRVEPELSRFCLAKSVDPTEPKYRLSTGRGAPQIAAASEFHGASVLRVRLIADGQDCNAQCRASVGASIIQALAQWRAGCTRCRASTLSLVEVDGAQFISVRYIETAMQWPYLRPQQNSQGVLASEVAAMATSQGAGVDVRMGFQRVDGVTSDLALCATDAPTTAAPGFAVLSEQVRDRVCRPTRAAACDAGSGCKEIAVRLSGASDCANALACGYPDQSITLNTPRFRFGLMGPDPSRQPTASLGKAGPGQRQDYVPLHPVIVHEVGHWFGLPHVESDPGSDDRDEVMIDTGGSDKVCISRAALNMLDSAVDQAWQFRHVGKGLLRYAPR